MSTERTRDAGRFFGLFLFLVQLRLLYKFFDAVKDDYETIAHMPFSDIFARMDWLKPSAYSGERIASFALWALLFAVGICGALWMSALLRWYRGRHD
jgi:hypothetical protein